MTMRRLILLVGAIAVVAGLIGLLIPVSTSDGNNGTIGCGNAVAADLSGARSANDHSVASVPILNQVVPHIDYVAQCQSALSARRTWTIPATVVGALVVAGGLFVRGGRRAAVAG